MAHIFSLLDSIQNNVRTKYKVWCIISHCIFFKFPFSHSMRFTHDPEIGNTRKIKGNQGIQDVLSSGILPSPSRCVLWPSKSSSLSSSLNLLIFLHFMVVWKVLATIMNYNFRLSWKSRNSSYIRKSLPYIFTYGKKNRENHGFFSVLLNSRSRTIYA